MNLNLILKPNEKEFYELIMTEWKTFFIQLLSEVDLWGLTIVENAIRKFRVLKLSLPSFLDPLTEEEIKMVKTASLALNRQTLLSSFNYLDGSQQDHFRIVIFKSFLQELL